MSVSQKVSQLSSEWVACESREGWLVTIGVGAFRLRTTSGRLNLNHCLVPPPPLTHPLTHSPTLAARNVHSCVSLLLLVLPLMVVVVFVVLLLLLLLLAACASAAPQVRQPTHGVRVGRHCSEPRRCAGTWRDWQCGRACAAPNAHTYAHAHAHRHTKHRHNTHPHTQTHTHTSHPLTLWRCGVGVAQTRRC